MDLATQTRKWKKHRLSKHQVPNFKQAENAMKARLGREVSHMTRMDTRTEWVFAEKISD